MNKTKTITAALTTLGFVAAATVVTRGWDAASVPMSSEMNVIKSVADRGQPIVDLCTAIAHAPTIPYQVARVIKAGLGSTDGFASAEQVKICVTAATRTAVANENTIAAGKVFGYQIEAIRSHDGFRLSSIETMYKATAKLEEPTKAKVVKAAFNLEQ